MVKLNICLSAKGIQNIPFEQYEKDFIFVVDGKKIKTNRFLADFISPKISQIHRIDPTISSFVINEDTNHLSSKENSKENSKEAKSKGNITKGIITKEIMEEFIEMGKGERIEIEIDERKFEAYEEICTILQNEEIFEQIEEHFLNTREINFKDCIFTLKLNEKKQEKTNIILQLKEKEIIEYLGAHFYEILKDEEMREEMKQMSTDTIYKIINEDKLVIKDENELMDFIIELIEKKKENTILLENIIFEMISETKFENLIEIFDPNEMTIKIWDKMSKCFHPKKIHIKENEKENIMEMNSLIERRYLVKNLSFPFVSNERFEGIISYLTRKNGTIEVTSSSYQRDFFPKNVIDLENKQNEFWSENKENSWICFDFKEKRIELSNYTITSRYGSNCHHPQTWVLEGSNDRANWRVIDENIKGNKGDFSQTLQNLSFSIIKKENEENYFQYIRLRQTGPNSQNQHVLIFTAIEFYGNLKE